MLVIASIGLIGTMLSTPTIVHVEGTGAGIHAPLLRSIIVTALSVIISDSTGGFLASKLGH